jgi:SAM-dependent methyltransferase
MARGSDGVDANHGVFNADEVVASYSAMEGLTEAEGLILASSPRTGADVLDLGVGTGRTTPALRGLGGRYVGIDYASGMIRAARQLHPNADLRVGDAAHLDDFGDATFDLVVFAYNGLDYLSDAQRRTCLAESYRVLRPAGTFVFSTHNPRAIVCRSATLPGGRMRRLAVGSYISVRRAIRLIPTRAFLVGDGYVLDPARGGLTTHMAMPRRVSGEVEAFGFRLVRVVAADHPHRSSRWKSPSFYYEFTRS